MSTQTILTEEARRALALHGGEVLSQELQKLIKNKPPTRSGLVLFWPAMSSSLKYVAAIFGTTIFFAFLFVSNFTLIVKEILPILFLPLLLVPFKIIKINILYILWQRKVLLVLKKIANLKLDRAPKGFWLATLDKDVFKILSENLAYNSQIVPTFHNQTLQIHNVRVFQ